jgi:hypothetical protein
MKGQCRSTDFITPYRRVIQGLALIRHVPEYVSVFILGPRRAQVRPYAPVEHFHLSLVIPGAFDSAKANKASPTDQLSLDIAKAFRESGQWEIIPTDFKDVI